MRIAVAPERRRLGVGSELLGAIVATASSQQVSYLACQHPAAEPAPGQLARALGLVVACRVVDGRAETLAILAQNGRGLDKRREVR